MMEGEGFGFGFGSGDSAFLRGWLVCLLAWLVGVESGSKVVFCWIAFAFAFAFAFALLCCWCCWESLWFKGEKKGRVLVVR